MLNLSLSNLVAVSLNKVGDADLQLLSTNLSTETSWALSLLDKTVEGSGLLLGAWPSKCCFEGPLIFPIL